METDNKYYNQILWEHQDQLVTENFINIQMFFFNNQYTLSSPTNLMITIGNYKRKVFNRLNISHKEVFLYLSKCKPIIDNIDTILKDIDTNKNIQKSFVLQCHKKIHTTIMYRNEYNFCVRFCITENREADFDESEKIFMSYYDYLSLLKILTNYRDNYISICSNNLVIVYNDRLLDVINQVNEKLTNYYKEMKSLSKRNEKSLDIEEVISSSDIISTPQIEVKNQDVTIQSDFSNYMKDNVDKIKLDPDLEKKLEDAKKYEPPKNDLAIDGIFTKKFINGDILNLENYLTSCLTDKNCFYSLVSIIASKLETTVQSILPGCSKKDIDALSYITTKSLKYYLNSHLEKSHDLPPNVIPVIYKNAECQNMNLDIMHDLMLYFIFYTNIKNQLSQKDKNTTNNKEIICFTLKNLLTPLVFSFIKCVKSKDVFANEIVARYDKYKNDNIFTNLFTTLSSKYRNVTVPSSSAIKENVIVVYDKVMQLFDKFTIESSFEVYNQKGIIKLDYKTFTDTELTEDQLQKIFLIESNMYKNNGSLNENDLSIPFSSLLLLPTIILKKYGIEFSTDTSNLKRFVNESKEENKFKDMALQIIENIKISYRDLKGLNFDYALLPDLFLKAICVWDLEDDRTLSLNYNKLKDKIESCTLSKTMILSIIGNITEKKTSNFMESLSISEIK